MCGIMGFPCNYGQLLVDDLHELLFGILKAVCQEVDWLHLCNGVLLEPSGEWIQRPYLRLVRETVLHVCA